MVSFSQEEEGEVTAAEALFILQALDFRVKPFC